MMIRTRTDVMDRLRAAGYTRYRLRRDKLLGSRIISQIARGDEISHGALNTVCQLLGCSVGEVLEYVPDADGGEATAAQYQAPQIHDGSTGASG